MFIYKGSLEKITAALKVLLIAPLLLVVFNQNVSATLISAADFELAFGTPHGGTQTYGWSFMVNQEIQLVSLGYLDVGLDGLIDEHDIGLWSDSGTLLRSSTVSSGTISPLADGFRYASVEAFSLLPGFVYVVGGYTTSASDLIGFSSNIFFDGFAPEVTFVQGRYRGSSELTFPTNSVDEFAYLGASFQFQQVPEPTSIKIFGLALCLFVLFRQSKMSKVNQATTIVNY